MAQLNVKLGPEQAEALRRYAARRRTPVAWLIKDYVEYLLSGADPVRPPAPDAPTGQEMAALAEKGGSLDWLAEEPDLYTTADGEPV